MAAGRQLRTVGGADLAEIIGPAEGQQYTTQGMLGTGPEGQPQNTGRDAFTIVIPVDSIEGMAPKIARGLCFDLTWTPGTGRAVQVRLNKTDCTNGYGTENDIGSISACIKPTAGTYILNIINPLDDSQEVSFPYTLTVTGPEGTEVWLSTDEGAESPQICDKI